MFVDGMEEALEFGVIGKLQKQASISAFVQDRQASSWHTQKLKLGLSSSCKKEIEAVGFGGSGRNVGCGK